MPYDWFVVSLFFLYNTAKHANSVLKKSKFFVMLDENGFFIIKQVNTSQCTSVRFYLSFIEQYL